MIRPREYIAFLKQSRQGRTLVASLNALRVATLVVLAIIVIGPLTYDNEAHHVLDAATRHWSGWGDQLLGLDITAPRQNLFSLARDLDRTITVVDHTTVHTSRMIGLTNFLRRGPIATVADALRWFDIPLTANQARTIQPCTPLDRIREDQPIVVQPDPYQHGIASWYGPGFHDRLAASGELYNMYDLTAAHKTLPLQSLVRVVANRNGNSIVVRINDRGPYVGSRIIDMSYRAKQSLDMEGLASVYIERLDPTALNAPCE